MCEIVTWRNLCQHCETAAQARKQKKVEYFPCHRAEYIAGTKDVRLAFRACGLRPERRIQDYFGNIEGFADRTAYS